MTTSASADIPAPPRVLLGHHLRQLKLPTILREYEKVAAEAAREGQDHVRYLLRLVELELIDRERRMVERGIRITIGGVASLFKFFGRGLGLDPILAPGAFSSSALVGLALFLKVLMRENISLMNASMLGTFGIVILFENEDVPRRSIVMINFDFWMTSMPSAVCPVALAAFLRAQVSNPCPWLEANCRFCLDKCLLMLDTPPLLHRDYIISWIFPGRPHSASVLPYRCLEGEFFSLASVRAS